MEKIASFTIDHTRLLPGVYVSRRDGQGDGRVTTFDRARKGIGLFILAPWAAARAFI